MLKYTLIRSQRKTVVLRITKEARVEVRAPMKMPITEIDKFVLLKEEWIRSRLEKREENIALKAEFTIDYGDMVVLCGKEYPICGKEGQRVGFTGESFLLPPGLPPETIKEMVIEIYKKVAKRIITSKVNHFAALMNVQPTAVKINSAKTRWGSCSGKNSLNFSWFLIMADNCAIDYVVVHELSHIREHNHSSRFWAVVKSIIPDYERCELALKKLQAKLAGESWE